MKLRDKFPQNRIRDISEFVSFGLVSEKHYKAKITLVDGNNHYARKAYSIELGDEAKMYPCDEEAMDMMKNMTVMINNMISELPDSVKTYMKEVDRKIERMESIQKYGGR
jgi:hypothetical protein